MAGKAKRTKLTDQLRQTMDGGPKTRYQISKETGLDEATLSRFVHHKGGLSMEGLDAIADCLGLNLTADGPTLGAKKPKRK